MGFDNLTSEHLAIIVLGMGSVFVLLILISFVVSLLKYVPALLGKKEAESAKAAAAGSVAAGPVAADSAQGTPSVGTDDKTLAAVITAAIYAFKNQGAENIESKDEYVVRSIRRL